MSKLTTSIIVEDKINALTTHYYILRLTLCGGGASHFLSILPRSKHN